MATLSATIITWNEEKNIERAIKSVSPYVNEVIVVDMSTNNEDKTTKIAKKLKAKVYKHLYTGYVEPARNFAFKKATGEWIFVLDADEEIQPSLGEKLKSLSTSSFDYFEIPRKNIVFGKWLVHSRWWPDYLIRFFRKDCVQWPNEIHVQPTPKGDGKKLDPIEENSIIHHHYDSINQYLEKLIRYTDHQAIKLAKEGYILHWQDLITKPTNEFLSRFYYGEGYKDGIHGLAVALLQAISELVLHLKVWEMNKFSSPSPNNLKKEFEFQITRSIKDWLHWAGHTQNFIYKFKSKILKIIL